MTTCEWLYAQSIFTDQALESANTEEERTFWVRRLHELQGRIAFEQRQLERQGTPAPDVEDEF
jgi:hypothetical protein